MIVHVSALQQHDTLAAAARPCLGELEQFTLVTYVTVNLKGSPKKLLEEKTINSINDRGVNETPNWLFLFCFFEPKLFSER